MLFRSPGRYDEIMEHIATHKYFINESSPTEISMEDAIRSWYQTVYKPIADTIREERLSQRFPGRTASDLYAYIVKHWGVLKKRYGLQLPASVAARDFSTRYGKGFWQRLKALFSGS